MSLSPADHAAADERFDAAIARVWSDVVRTLHGADGPPEDFVVFLERDGFRIMPRNLAVVVLMPVGDPLVANLRTDPPAGHAWFVGLFGSCVSSSCRAIATATEAA